MTQPGRKSSAARAIFPVDRHGPPAPSEHLPEEVRAAWHKIVVAFQPSWFRGSESVLETYCEIVVAKRKLAAELGKAEPSSERYAALLRLFVQVATTLAILATKLRLAPLSSRDSRHTKLAPPGPYPWEQHSDATDDDDEVEPSLGNDGEEKGERDFSSLRARRGVRATIACSEVADDAAAFLGTQNTA
jgi:hypothetical protein